MPTGKVQNTLVTELRRDQIYTALGKKVRVDGRAPDESRPIRIETGVIRKAQGSARVYLGSTQVLVGVKLMPGTPFPDTPKSGVIISNAELVPMASPIFEPGPPNENAIELARLVDRGVRESKAIDLEKLFIEENKVWMLFVDVHALDDDGNLIDAACIGATAALLTAKVPRSQFGLGEDIPLEVRHAPVAVTVADVRGHLIVDPGLDEGAVADSRLTVMTREDGALCGLQKGGTGSLSPERLEEMVRLGIEKGKERRKLLPRQV
ncbi:MAG: exosome complex protein Rrp42 [Halobacteria archaeon]